MDWNSWRAEENGFEPSPVRNEPAKNFLVTRAIFPQSRGSLIDGPFNHNR